MINKIKDDNVRDQILTCTKNECCQIATVYNDGSTIVKKFWDEFYEPWEKYSVHTIVENKEKYDFWGDIWGPRKS